MATEHLDAIREMKAHFVPFRLVTTSGEQVLVKDRFQFAVTPKFVFCYLLPDLKRSVVLTADQIAEVRPIEEKPAA